MITGGQRRSLLPLILLKDALHLPPRVPRLALHRRHLLLGHRELLPGLRELLLGLRELLLGLRELLLGLRGLRALRLVLLGECLLYTSPSPRD